MDEDGRLRTRLQDYGEVKIEADGIEYDVHIAVCMFLYLSRESKYDERCVVAWM